MPKNSSTAILNVVPVVDATAYAFSPADYGAAVRQVPGAGLALELPAHAQSGDQYRFWDVDGSCGAGNVITVHAADGAPVMGGASLPFAQAFSSATFTFDEEAGAWMASKGALPSPPAPTVPNAFNAETTSSEAMNPGLNLVVVTAPFTFPGPGNAQALMWSVCPIEFVNAVNVEAEIIAAVDFNVVDGSFMVFAPLNGTGKTVLTWSGLITGITPGAHVFGLFFQTNSGTFDSITVGPFPATVANVVVQPQP